MTSKKTSGVLVYIDVDEAYPVYGMQAIDDMQLNKRERQRMERCAVRVPIHLYRKYQRIQREYDEMQAQIAAIDNSSAV